jgi:hypothetical protein
MIGLIILTFIAIHFAIGLLGLTHLSKGLSLNQKWNETLQYGLYVALTFAITSSLYVFLFVLMFLGKHFIGEFGLISAVLFFPGLLIFALAYLLVPNFFGNTENRHSILKSGIGLACPACSLFLLVYQDYLLSAIAK